MRGKDGAEGGPTKSGGKSSSCKGAARYRPSYLPPPRSSCIVIYIGRISSPQIAFLNTTRRLCPPFNLRESLFRVRGPCCLPPKPPPRREAHPSSLSLSLSYSRSYRPPLGPCPRCSSSTPSTTSPRTCNIRPTLGFSEKGVSYITAVITNGIIGYTRDSTLATERRSSRKPHLRAVSKGTFARSA